jgi:DNA-binding transcriptional LysR family regulator
MPIFTTATRCLVEVIEAGSIRRAAETLNTAPSAINRHILNLEAEYRTTFLERLPRGVRATPAGRLMAEQIRRWQADLERVSDDLAKLRGQERQQMAIGIMECFAGSFFAEVLVGIRKQYPDANIVVRVAGTREMLTLLEGGDVDLVLGFNMPPSSDYWVVETIPISLGVAVAPEHPFAGRASVSPAECENASLLLVDESLSLRPLTDTLFPNASPWSKAPLTSNSIVMIKHAVRMGDGISILTRFDVRDELKTGQLALVPLDAPNVRENLAICMRDQSSVTPLGLAFTQAIVAAIRRELSS